MANSFRTDLAMEAREQNGEISGVKMEQRKCASALVTRIQVLNEEGAKKLGKPIGTYITIEQRDLYEKDPQDSDELVQCIARQIANLLNDACKEGCSLVVGLGNRELTPDSLGPRVVSEVLVTRHLKNVLSEEMRAQLCSVCAIAPGVMGETGMETGEVVKAVVGAVNPSCVIVVDALAARSTQRILSTVQITDAGVAPGSGVGNHRSALTRESLGVPVIAVGVPMVVHASTILHDALERIAGSNVSVDSLLRNMEGENLVVTPVMIDEAVRCAAKLVAQAINTALQPALSPEEIKALSI